MGTVGILVGIYFVLKKDAFNCMGGKRKAEEEEESEFESDLEEEKKPEFIPNSVDEDVKEDIVLEDLKRVEEEEEEEEEELDNHLDLPDIVVTQTPFVAEKPKRSSSFKSVFKKITKPIGKVRFGGVTSKSSNESYPLVGSEDDTYGSLTPAKRSDSMESFLSGISVVSENIEEFGSEVSPGRLQTSLHYDKKDWVVKLGVKQAQYLIHTGSEKIYWQVHATLLPFKKHRFKTKYKSTSTPVFKQTFEVEDVAEQALSQLAFRFRVYGKIGRAGKKKLAGETVISLSCLQNSEGPLVEWNTLKRNRQKIPSSKLV